MPSGKTFADDAQELLSQVSFYSHVEGWIVPCDVSFSYPAGFFFLLFFGLNFNLYVYPLLSSAVWYVGAALLNTSSADEIFDSLWFIFSGIRLMMLGGWVEYSTKQHRR